MKKIFIASLLICIIAAVGYRIWYVNKNVVLPPIHTFNIGEEVAIGENIFMDDFENMNGYTVTVHNAEILPLQEYLLKNDYEEDSDDPLFDPDDFFSYPEMVYELHLTIRNTNLTDDPNEHSGINFVYYNLVGTDFHIQIDTELFAIANPTLDVGLTDGFRLQPNSEKDFYLPFTFQPSGKIVPIKEKAILNDDVYLVVSKIPNINRILIEPQE